MNCREPPASAKELAQRLVIHTKFAMVYALEAAKKNKNMAPLLRLLRSRPLTMDEQALLAAHLEGKSERKRGRPRGVVMTQQRLRRIKAAEIVRDVKRRVRASGENYRHGTIVGRALELLAERHGWRLTENDIENEFKRPTQIDPTGRTK